MSHSRNIDIIQKLAETINTHNIAEIEYEYDGCKLKINRYGSAPVAASSSERPSNVPNPVAYAAPVVQNSVEVGVESSASAGRDWSKQEGVITSPLVGTAYLAPQPGAEPFVKVGQSVKEGDILLLIEAMKVVNPIKAKKGGVVAHIFVENATPVEYGEPLVVVD